MNNEGIPETIENFIRRIADATLRHPKQLEIDVQLGSDDIATVTVSPYSNGDAGQFIGKDAKLLIAWRVVLKQLCGRLGCRCHFAPIKQPNRATQQPHTATVNMTELVRGMCADLFECEAKVELLDNTFFVELDADEQYHERPNDLEDAFSRLVNAASRANGRPMYVNLGKPLTKNTTHESHPIRRSRHNLAR